MLESLFLIPLYVTAALLLAFATFDEKRALISIANAIAAFAVFLAALAHFARNGCLLFTLIAGARGLVVFLTPIFGWFANTLLALTVVYAIFRAEVYLYVQLGEQGWQYTLAALIASTLIVALLVARRQTALSQSHPPLLALQLAPTRLAAKDVLERWGEKGRQAAQRALLLQSLFAALYGVTLAGIFDRVDVKNPALQKAAGYLAWLMLIAAACHLAQNLGAYVALRTRVIGWWVGVMRRLGWIRMSLLGLAAAYFTTLLLRREWYAALWLGNKISGWTAQ